MTELLQSLGKTNQKRWTKRMELTKKELKQRIANNMRMLFRKDVEEASKQQLFQAVAYS